jgi:hypothetical protein
MCGDMIWSLLLLLLLTLAGCEKPPPSSASQTNASPAASPGERQGAASPTPNREWGPAKFDVCGLIPREEIEKAQESRIKEASGVARPDGDFMITQCFYSAEVPSKSVSLAVTQRDLDRRSKRSPKDFWRETFGSNAEPNDRGRLRTARGKFIPPTKIGGLGDDAYWMGGALYVLKGDSYVRISVGGPGDEEAKREKSKTLAQQALSRF